MSRLLLATRSSGKLREFGGLLRPYGWIVVTPDDVGIDPSPEEDGLEIWDTFEANARAKARWFADRGGLPALADDSGLEVDRLAGAPGVRSKRFAGVDGPDESVTDANNRELLARLAGTGPEGRTARYRCVLVLAFPAGDGRRELVAEGTTSGTITEGPRGSGGFGYDPLFLSDDLGVTFGEAPPEAKARVSHRARAVRAMFSATG